MAEKASFLPVPRRDEVVLPLQGGGGAVSSCPLSCRVSPWGHLGRGVMGKKAECEGNEGEGIMGQKRGEQKRP